MTTTDWIDALLLPPGVLLVLLFAGLLIHRIRFGRDLVLISTLLLWISCMPLTANLLARGLESHPALTQPEQVKADAIVVLGGGRYIDAPEYGADTASPVTLFRLRYAAYLATKTGLPVIPSGSRVSLGGLSSAMVMKNILQDEYGLKVEHLEERSRNTWENARFSAQLLHELGYKRILLVTESVHMPRAVMVFERNGLDVIPAPTGFVRRSDRKFVLSDLMPSAKAAYDTHRALHEYLGLIWYRLR